MRHALENKNKSQVTEVTAFMMKPNLIKSYNNVIMFNVTFIATYD